MISKWCNQKEIHTPKTDVGKKLNEQSSTHTKKTYRKPIVSRVSSYFSPIGGNSKLNYENIQKVQTAKKFNAKTSNSKNHHRSIALERFVIHMYTCTHVYV